MEYMGVVGLGAITVICYLVGEAVKLLPLDNKWIPLACGLSGLCLGIAGMFVMPDFPAADYISAAAVGIVSGLAATGADQLAKQLEK